jgi:hypothetical protein
MRRLFSVVCALVVLSASAVRADILLYPLPGTNAAFALQGRVSVNPGGTLTFRHPRFGNLFFGLDKVSYYKAPSTREIAARRLTKAIHDQDADACIEAGSWALHHGLLPKFFEVASAAWKLDGTHPTVRRLAALKQRMDAPLPPTGKQELQMREFVPGGERMEFARSKHFLLLHDTPPTKTGRSKRTRAEERLELLETVYASLLLKFCLQGSEVEVPGEPLKVVLFAQKKNFLDFAKSLEASLSNAAGFFHREANISVFFDQGTNEVHQLLELLNQRLQADKKRAIKERIRGAKDLVRFAETIRLLTEVARENADIEVVSHEATHQLAANTGLMPNGAPVPLWAAEGLATYFESPKEAAWSGIGSVNKERLRWYRGLADDKQHSNIDFVVSDRVFTHAATDGAIAHAYGQAWALTHFLMDRHFDKLIQYYWLIGQNTSDVHLSPEEYQEAFDQVFGDVKAGLELDWRSYMRSLKTDLEMVLEEK